MSYLKKIEYEIVLKDSLWVLRNCPKCGRRTYFKNTKKFRVNANGSRLDVWLVYQCEECKHTLNISICERQKVSSMPKEVYQRFLDNDEQLAEMYGKDVQLFRRNKAFIDLDKAAYDFVKRNETTGCSDHEKRIVIEVRDPYQLKIRPERQIAEILGMSRSQVKNLVEKGAMEWKVRLPRYVVVSIDACQPDMDKFYH